MCQLRCFWAVAEELHFACAAERLHMDMSALSRTVKELEEDVDEQLFARTSRSTRLTRAWTLLLEHVLRVFTAFQQARDSLKAAVNGFHWFVAHRALRWHHPLAPPTLLAICRTQRSILDFPKYRGRSRSKDCKMTGMTWDLHNLMKWAKASQPKRCGMTH